MILRINGKEETLGKEARLMNIIEQKGLRQDRIVIEHNFEIVPREKWSEVLLKNGDNVEIVSFVGGG